MKYKLISIIPKKLGPSQLLAGDGAGVGSGVGGIVVVTFGPNVVVVTFGLEVVVVTFGAWVVTFGDSVVDVGRWVVVVVVVVVGFWVVGIDVVELLGIGGFTVVFPAGDGWVGSKKWYKIISKNILI